MWLRFAVHRLERLIQCRWDTFHRLIRDIKLSCLHGANGEYYQAQMYSQYLFSVSYRPYGSGAFQEEKKRALEIMMARETPESVPAFMENWEAIKKELLLPSWYTHRDVWKCLPGLQAFQCKQTMPKQGRWFSWNQAAHEQLKEWTALKTVLAYLFDADPSVDPDLAYTKRKLEAMTKTKTGDQDEDKTNVRKEFGRLKEKLGGGLKLCWHLMSKKLHQMVIVVLLCTRPLWCWYTSTVKNIKSPEDHIPRIIELMQHWNKDSCLGLLSDIIFLFPLC